MNLSALMNYKIFRLSVLIIAVMFLVCCEPEEQPHPCETPYVSTTYLMDEYDSLFPYSHQSTKLTYLYSNDTITNDTMVFELMDYRNWDIDTTSAERCFIDYQEVRRLYFESTSSVFKKLTIFWDGGASFKWEARENNESFSYTNDKNSDFLIYPSIYFNNNQNFAEIIDTYTLNYKKYYKVLKDFKCVSSGSQLFFSTNHGFIEIYNSCSNEYFTLLK